MVPKLSNAGDQVVQSQLERLENFWKRTERSSWVPNLQHIMHKVGGPENVGPSSVGKTAGNALSVTGGGGCIQSGGTLCLLQAIHVSQLVGGPGNV